MKHFSNHILSFVQDRLSSISNLSSGFFLCNSSTQHRCRSNLSAYLSGHFHSLQFYCVLYLGHSFQHRFLDVYFFSLVTVIHNLHHQTHLLSSFLGLYYSVYFFMSFLISILQSILPEEATVLHHFGPSYHLVRN